MINTKEDLKKYIELDNTNNFIYKNKKSKFFSRILQEEEYKIRKFKKLLRLQEYHFNNNHKLRNLYYCFCKNKLGSELGFLVPINCFDYGLVIHHYGSIIINDNTQIGKNCQLHGNNCIGNNGKSSDAPILGDNVDIGYGAIIIGNVEIGDNVKIGAGSVIIHDVPSNSTVVGIPGKIVKVKEE